MLKEQEEEPDVQSLLFSDIECFEMTDTEAEDEANEVEERWSKDAEIDLLFSDAEEVGDVKERQELELEELLEARKEIQALREELESLKKQAESERNQNSSDIENVLSTSLPNFLRLVRRAGIKEGILLLLKGGPSGKVGLKDLIQYQDRKIKSMKRRIPDDHYKLLQSYKRRR